MVKQKIKKIRYKLDLIDDKLLLVIKKRVSLVNKVIQIKQTKKEIVDKKRINSILKRIKKKIIPQYCIWDMNLISFLQV